MRSIAEQVEEIYRVTAHNYDRLITPCRVGQFAALIAELIGRDQGREVIEIGS